MTIYKLLVLQRVGGNLYIEAKDEEEARTNAQMLLDRGNACVEPDLSDYHGGDIEDIEVVSDEEYNEVSTTAREIQNIVETNKEAVENELEDN